MVLGLVGETIDVGDEVCGARIVDKSKNHHVVYRFELWLRSNENSTANRCVSCGGVFFCACVWQALPEMPALLSTLSEIQRVTNIRLVDQLASGLRPPRAGDLLIISATIHR